MLFAQTCRCIILSSRPIQQRSNPALRLNANVRGGPWILWQHLCIYWILEHFGQAAADYKEVVDDRGFYFIHTNL